MTSEDRGEPGSGSAVDALASIRRSAAEVEVVLDRFLADQRDRWRAVDPDLEVLVDAVGDLVCSGGKRLRPAFCLWAFLGAGGRRDDEAVWAAGAALEMLHSFALLHDDVMDASSTRRGHPTTHVTFAQRHRDEDWGGNARRFGDAVAILAGDLAFVWADELLPLERPDVARLWIDLRTELAVGQFLDVLGGARGHASADLARRIVRYKSGKYSVERPLHLGAAVAGRLDELGPGLTAVGLPLGDAFQLRDDVLGAFGDERRTGKPVGDDLREGKPTLLVALARQRAGDAGLTGFGDPDLDGAGVARIQAHLRDSGAVDEVEALIEALAGEAVAAIDRLPFDPEVRAVMADLALVATHRDR